ncbi:MAG: enoyl-CoA hydratase/isomerase family protein [Polaromonas sp.]|uniref:enoyl-CoA hydratase/isomerase family protein n=1 Tax=Polaromonas sp. TaxID=1869339 RepID=UPI002731E106|nr:enoyl-CoA hydratase/isomerase family protein [Polaromonas sp.]MDP2257417.1 enoyl-CoA hydratase/isomerase family protein [Polaromonas sp.]
MSGTVSLDISSAVAFVTLSHPGKFNAMSRAMWRELRAVFASIQQNSALRGVLIRGEGGHFCAGGDISEYAAFRFDEASLRDFHENDVWGGLQAMLDCDLLIVARIEGHCMGAGVEIASCCDLRLASDSARFGAPIAKLGFPMAPREAALVMRAVGELTAREMLLSAAVLGAADMQQRGFLNQVVPQQDLLPAVEQRLQAMAVLAPRAARLNKQTLRAMSRVHETGVVPRDSYRYADTAEHREGIEAFMAKRPPFFG